MFYFIARLVRTKRSLAVTFTHIGVISRIAIEIEGHISYKQEDR